MMNSAPVRTAALLLALSTPAVAQWLQRAPAVSPTARTAAAMTWDGVTGGLLLFGGAAPLINNQTWSYDGINWTQLTPATSPSARFGAQLVYDIGRNVCVLYGGLASNISVPPPVSDTWEWNGTTWTQIATPANAGPRYRYGACYDHVRGRTVMFGGASSQLPGAPNSQTWEYDGTTWTQVTTAGTPGGRDRPAMCFHSGIGKAVLFGGSDGANVTNSTWLYDGTTWTQVPVVGSVPPARSSACLTYDSWRNVCVLSGGQDAAGVIADTWTFDGTSWTQQPYTTPGRRDHMQAFLPSTQQVVMFGGFVAPPNTTSNQTWEFGNGVFGVGCAGTNGVPSLVQQAAPQLGLPWTLDIANMPAFNLGIMVFGFTQLPGIDLGGLVGMPGCLLYTSADLLVTATATGPGTAQWTWPAVTGLVGDTFYAQALVLDPTVNAFGFTISNAIWVTLNS